MTTKQAFFLGTLFLVIFIVFKKTPHDLCSSAYNAVIENLVPAKWEPGSKHKKIPHIHATKTKGLWAPDDGYVWTTSYNQEWKSKRYIKQGVEWEPELTHPKHKNVQSSNSEGKWEPKPGYKFKNADSDDFEVVKVPSKEEIYAMLLKLRKANYNHNNTYDNNNFSYNENPYSYNTSDPFLDYVGNLLRDNQAFLDQLDREYGNSLINNQSSLEQLAPTKSSTTQDWRNSSKVKTRRCESDKNDCIMRCDKVRRLAFSVDRASDLSTANRHSTCCHDCNQRYIQCLEYAQ